MPKNEGSKHQKSKIQVVLLNKPCQTSKIQNLYVKHEVRGRPDTHAGVLFGALGSVFIRIVPHFQEMALSGLDKR